MDWNKTPIRAQDASKKWVSQAQSSNSSVQHLWFSHIYWINEKIFILCWYLLKLRARCCKEVSFSSPWLKFFSPSSVTLTFEPRGEDAKWRYKCFKEVKVWSPCPRWSNPTSVISRQPWKLREIPCSKGGFWRACFKELNVSSETSVLVGFKKMTRSNNY